MPQITVLCQTYNTKEYLQQCISSVLSQTRPDFRFLIVDNGCTDGSSELLEAYAREDPRIKLIHRKKNDIIAWYEELRRHQEGKYLATIDSDDWWEPDFLERMIGFLEEHDLDLATTGTMAYWQKRQEGGILRKLEQPVLLTQQEYAERFPVYCMYPNTVWGSILKLELFWKADIEPFVSKRYPFGLDTICMLEYIKQCRRIGIDSSALYHYRIQPKSVTYQYFPLRLDGIIARFEKIREFLTQHGAYDAKQAEWAMRTHLLYMNNTLKVLCSSDLDAAEKLKECARFASVQDMPHLLGDFSNYSQANTLKREWREMAWSIVFQAANCSAPGTEDSLQTIAAVLCPHCAAVLQPRFLRLLQENEPLYTALMKDDPSQLASLILKLIAENRYPDGTGLEEIVQSLLPDESPLQVVSDSGFFQVYADCCLNILYGNYRIRLEDMTGALLRNEVQYAQEDYLKLYLTLAAWEGEVSAFLFGKVQLAWFYLRNRQADVCRLVLEELEEMGMEENDEVQSIRQRLEQCGL